MKRITMIGIVFLLSLFLIQCSVNGQQEVKKMNSQDDNTRIATLAGGCFWCVESDFEKVPGVIQVISGYAGGTGSNPTYENYAQLGYVEAVQVYYNPQIISYGQILDYFWRHIDPTDAGGQFVDRGPQYRSAIFYQTKEEKDLAQKSKEALAASGHFKKPIVTEILKLGHFYEAENYHQNYYRKNPLRYKFYRFNSGRDRFLEQVWGREKDVIEAPASGKGRKPDDRTLKTTLTPLQYKVTQENGTEPAFHNEYWDNKQEGIYVDIVSGEPLFSSHDKYDSGTGWPSFTKPLEPGNIILKEDNTLFTTRTEVRSRLGDSHLGHVFNDGPPPTGLRYCMNSAALRFIPRANLEKEGYGQYLKLFQHQ